MGHGATGDAELTAHLDTVIPGGVISASVLGHAPDGRSRGIAKVVVLAPIDAETVKPKFVFEQHFRIRSAHSNSTFEFDQHLRTDFFPSTPLIENRSPRPTSPSYACTARPRPDTTPRPTTRRRTHTHRSVFLTQRRGQRAPSRPMRGLLLNELAQRVWAVHTEELRADGHIGDLCVGQPPRIGILDDSRTGHPGALSRLTSQVKSRLKRASQLLYVKWRGAAAPPRILLWPTPRLSRQRRNRSSDGGDIELWFLR